MNKVKLILRLKLKTGPGGLVVVNGRQRPLSGCPYQLAGRHIENIFSNQQ